MPCVYVWGSDYRFADGTVCCSAMEATDSNHSKEKEKVKYLFKWKCHGFMFCLYFWLLVLLIMCSTECEKQIRVTHLLWICRLLSLGYEKPWYLSSATFSTL